MIFGKIRNYKQSRLEDGLDQIDIYDKKVFFNKLLLAESSFKPHQD